MKYIIYFFTCTVAFCSCKFKNNYADEKLVWNQLVITSEGRVEVNIKNYVDTSTALIFNRGSIFSPVKKIKVDTVKVIFTQTEKDSLAILTKSLIVDPVNTKRFCTDFVGHLQLVIKTKNVTQQADYQSVCDWIDLSDATKQMHRILKRKIKSI